jgi:hypothetical protein
MTVDDLLLAGAYRGNVTMLCALRLPSRPPRRALRWRVRSGHCLEWPLAFFKSYAQLPTVIGVLRHLPILTPLRVGCEFDPEGKRVFI